MSMNPEALQRMIGEMSLSIQKNKSELDMVDVQIQRRANNIKLYDLTLKELKQPGSKSAFAYDEVWKGVGKAFLKIPTEEYVKDMEKETNEFKSEIESLSVKKNYVERTLTNTIEGMNRIFEKK